MKYISVTLIVSVIFAVYVVNTIWTLSELFIPPVCSRGERCYSSYISSNPVQHLVIYTSIKKQPSFDRSINEEVNKVHTLMRFDYRNPVTL